ncbi:M56 family metallopeptidase [Sediminicola luteus]|uniref:TonB C-terminal domain-containing protein n=1 Tax=Sediminicola luteus TaxID=319238 RepID=A0A2A4GDX3_9FLAO|nr:M56 family metallopeptidase [Sediminicola luteus]PCE65962.1 hypothetical protein B7P33_01275 [Sediminicola luteus]
MIRYLIEVMAFQLGFLIIYDLFLKKETFFQWNRAYLIGAFSLALVLPSISLPVFRATVAPDTLLYPHFLIQLDEVVLGAGGEASGDTLPWEFLIPIVGSVLALMWFVFKLVKIWRLHLQGELKVHFDHNQIQLPDSETAFSFFKNVFLGDRLTGAQKASILKHELVHVRQWHSLDLLFFELMRVLFWFNPLVYIYQKKTSELHEYLADTGSGVPKKEQYQLLLSETFGTRDISFINPFYKKSLLKKRMDMLRKKPSHQLKKMKYLLLLPLLGGMLLYTSCETEQPVDKEKQATLPGVTVIDENSVEFRFSGEDFTAEDERNALKDLIFEHLDDKERFTIFIKGQEGNPYGIYSIQNGSAFLQRKADDTPNKILPMDGQTQTVGVPFSRVEKVPVFPGCENDTDPRACFQREIQKHIRENFRYPEEAQQQGIQGRVSVLFTVDTDGSIANVRLRGPHKLLETEAARIISELPQMTPGEQKGKKVQVPFAIPITFKLSSQANNDKTVQRKPIGRMRVLGKMDNNGHYKGKVTDSKGLNLPGVNILATNSEAYAVSDFDGNFSIEVTQGEQLGFSFSGLPDYEMIIE